MKDENEITGIQSYSKKSTAISMKKFVLFIVTPLVIIGSIGFLMIAVGAALPLFPLTIIGFILVGLGYIPLLILGIIFAYRRGIMWGW